ncbi:MAG: RdgB/HAM1 family non-canonical purine NTP pyrophosphatase [Chloroflexi bacterium]|nr:RdgB/HAM1 family non-canonical purine NTP pyrophosphatase [Chloroflexota bacterium]
MERQKLFIASNNQGKIREYRELLACLPLEVTWPAREGIQGEPEETGDTFEANALLKARYFGALAPGCSVIGDDSGLEVDALGGEPGVHSARYAGSGATDAQRNQLLLSRLRGVPWERRTARFVCVIALVRPAGEQRHKSPGQGAEGEAHELEATYCGTRQGYITLESTGTLGFGYDPIFYVPQLGKTFAELEPEVKNRWSHRAEAARKLVEALRSRFPEHSYDDLPAPG